MNYKCLMLVVIVTIFLTAPSAPAAQADNPAIGKRLYQSYCAICHGHDGHSRGLLARKRKIKPVNLTKDEYQNRSVGELAKIIGGYATIKRDVMPEWGEELPETNLRHIAAYILRMKTIDLKEIGDPKRGKSIYDTSCVACHGAAGKGDGLLARLVDAKMINFDDPKSVPRFADKALVDMIGNGGTSYMIAWREFLHEDQLIDVAAYVRKLSGQ